MAPTGVVLISCAKEQHAMNRQTLEGNWNQILGMVRQQWGQLTEEDLESARGSAERLVGVIQEKTGEARDAIEDRLEELLGAASRHRSGAAKEEPANWNMDDIRERVGEQAQDAYEQAQNLVRSRPSESIAVAFGAGILVGTVVGLMLRAGSQKRGLHDSTEQIGRRIADAILSVVPNSIRSRVND
jgi:uncharacterized protein YjbJ (UPF0337 family)